MCREENIFVTLVTVFSNASAIIYGTENCRNLRVILYYCSSSRMRIDPGREAAGGALRRRGQENVIPSTALTQTSAIGTTIVRTFYYV